MSVGSPPRPLGGSRLAVFVVVVIVVVAVAVSGLLGGCTREAAHRAGATSSTAPSASAAPVALRVQVTHVAGHLSPSGRKALAARIDRTLTSYAAAAFVAGRYPRSDFDRSFATFTSGAAERAVKDEDLLTNRPLGESTTSVRLLAGTAYLSVLAPRQHPSGVSAAVDWLFRVDQGQGRAQRVRLTGRLLLTEVQRGSASGAWRIFGYDVSRAASPAGSGS